MSPLFVTVKERVYVTLPPGPVICFPQITLPEGSSLTKNISRPVAVAVKLRIPGPGSTSMFVKKSPDKYTLPRASVAILYPKQYEEPPIRLAHKKFPAGSSFET